MQDGAADQDDYVARNHQHRKPERKLPVVGIDFAPVANAQGDDSAEKKAFVCNRIKDYAKCAALIVAPRDVSIEPITRRSDQENHDSGITLPFLGSAALNAFTVVNRHKHEERNQGDAGD